MASSPPGPGRPIAVFFSYAHEDEGLRDELAKHLRLLERQRIIAGWHDRRITGGAEWAGAIDDNLHKANIVLLLVSADFLASNYCYDAEVQYALDRHAAGEARVIPIILRPVDWHSAPFGKLQFLPKDGRPVTTWTHQDEAFADIARGIRSVAEESVLHPLAVPG
jgi:TIR domain-containing protein